MPRVKQIEQSVSHKMPSKSADKKAIKKLSVAKPKLAKSKPTKATPKKASAGGQAKGGGNVRSIIGGAIAELEKLGFAEVPRGHAALFAGYEGGGESPGFKKALSGLKKEDTIDYPSASTVHLTDKGRRQYAENVQAPTTNQEVLDRLLKVLNKSGKSDSKASLICQCLIDGRSHSLEEVAKESGYPSSKSSGFPKAVGKLSSFGIIERTKGSKMLRLADLVFPFGREGAGEGESDGDSE